MKTNKICPTCKEEFEAKRVGDSLWATYNPISLPSNITGDELRQAHLEACVEEELTNGQE